ncbi:UPF0481 protein At3g47200-like [Magnolia sinica]|uniref:UPF0481 protein At3g47200-like n=1 Tax=Magnolia sinica TaxID=86752 RepID=UPI00265A6F9D|nr:UPF0481 protein At3g47200-like [Magnolia sinica]
MEKERIAVEEAENLSKHVAVDINSAWLNSMNEKLAASNPNPSPKDSTTIFRVPQIIRQTDAGNSYDPQIISIGPFHRSNQQLQSMEEHKWRYLNNLLSRSPYSRLEDCLMEIKAMEAQARSCYSDSIDVSSDEFVETMVIDGCFIIELFLKQKEATAVDPIYQTAWMIPLIARDMLLLENQLPFFILQRLFELTVKSSHSSLIDLTFDFYRHLFIKDDGLHITTRSIHHLLHLFHSHLLPSPPPDELHPNGYAPLPSMPSAAPPPPRMIPSATELQLAGVRFKKNDKVSSFLDVKFSKGVMEIPLLSIYEYTGNLLRNFIAFEQCLPIVGNHFTSYAILMNCLVDTSTDVDILYQSKIIEHRLGSDDEVARLINQMTDGITIDIENCYLSSLFKEVKAYSEDVWHAWRASMVRNYFSSPWAIISLIAGILAFILTITMSFFSIYSFFHPPRLRSNSVLINRMIDGYPM